MLLDLTKVIISFQSSLTDLVDAIGSSRHDSCKGSLHLDGATNVVGDASVDASVRVELLWPRERCRLLSDDVILVDSPGVDVDVDFDEW